MAKETEGDDKSGSDHLETMQATVKETLEQLIETADVEHVYGRPIKQGEVAIIPSAEVLTAVAFGIGSGLGSSADGEGYGGGGGGGRTLARPVAVIIASPDGVRVEPVFDPTKIMLAALTAGGFMVGMLSRMFKSRRRMRKR
jgi:uncharacterized spore protein YtfJ